MSFPQKKLLQVEGNLSIKMNNWLAVRHLRLQSADSYAITIFVPSNQAARAAMEEFCGVAINQ